MLQQSMLSFVKSDVYEKEYERYLIGQVGTLIAVDPCLGKVSTRSCRMVDISRGGASFTVNSTRNLPIHYYLHIMGARKRIGCAEIFRRDKTIRVHFIKPIEEAFLHQIVRHEFFTGNPLLIDRQN